MLELEEALARVLSAMPPPAEEVISLSKADGRVVNRTVHSPMDLPPFDNSSMDGYAVRSADLTLAKAESPVRLRLAGRVPAGESFPGEVNSGTCVRLFTGSPVPRGADAVVMQEDTRVESEQAVAFLEGVVAGENIRWRGEDVRAGQALPQA